MSDTCSSSLCGASNPTKHRCPVNGFEYPEVPEKTVKHHIKEAWLWDGKDQSYYFCDDPECEVVYFGEDDSVILLSQVRASVGVKWQKKNAMLCYCFGATLNDALNDKEIRNFVIEQTRHGECSCETSNPSGRCCLKYFPH